MTLVQSTFTDARILRKGFNDLMKLLRYFFIAALFLYRSPGFAAQVDFRISKIHALFVFAQTASGEPHRSKAFLEFFEKSPMNNPEVKAILNDFNAVHSQMTEGFEFNGMPKDRKSGSSGDSLFLIQTVFAKNLDDLETRTIGLLPISQHLKMMSALRRLLPYYEKYVWSPNFKKLERRKKKIVATASHANMQNLFVQAATLYGTKWPVERQFVISFYPIPGNMGHTSAEQNESVESVGVLTDKDDSNGQFGVMFHEMCHSLYEAQTPERQTEIDKWFKEEPAPYSLIAYTYINEALAAALGNGLAAERALGHADDKSWYNDRYINGFAKALYPIVKEYLKEKRAIDQEFVKNAVLTFKDSFPEATLDIERAFNRIEMLVDSDALSPIEIKESMSKTFRVSSRSVYNEIDDTKGLSAIKESSDTVLIFETYKNLDRLKSLPSDWKAVNEALRAYSHR